MLIESLKIWWSPLNSVCKQHILILNLNLKILATILDLGNLVVIEMEIVIKQLMLTCVSHKTRKYVYKNSTNRSKKCLVKNNSKKLTNLL